MRGTEHVPTCSPALLAVNHVSQIDFILGGSPLTLLVGWSGAWRARDLRAQPRASLDALDALQRLDRAEAGGPYQHALLCYLGLA